MTAPIRLSTWLLNHPQATAHDDLIGLSWQSDLERTAQTQQKQALLRDLIAAAPGLPSLSNRLAALPVTGRVRVAKADARWLEVNPQADPILQTGDTVVAPARSEWVGVWLADGGLCRVRHQPGVAAWAYVHACAPMLSAAHVWVVQPDGHVQRVGTASWSETSQDAPAPGAWLWAPGTSDDVPSKLSDRIAETLATQGPFLGHGDPSWTQNMREGRLTNSAPLASDARDLRVSTNDWGVVGILQTPTARMNEVGDAGITLSRVSPYTNIILRVQPFSWLELGFGYTSVTGVRYGAQDFSGDQSYKDKTAHVKARLWKESTWVPEIAVGLRDFAGTGLFEGEYLVASKRWGSLDFSLGLGWGYVGGSGEMGNPLSALSSHFDTRPAIDTPTGGQVNAKDYFTGRTALFGGIQYQLPWDKWVFKLEREGNDYKNSPLGNVVQARSQWNVGLVYSPWSWMDLGMGYERGHTAMVSLNLHAPLNKLYTPKILDPKAPTVSTQWPDKAGPPQQTAQDIERLTDMHVRRITAYSADPAASAPPSDASSSAATSTTASNATDANAPAQNRQSLRVTLDATDLGWPTPAVDRISSVLHRDAPASVTDWKLDFDLHGVVVAQAQVNRDEWVKSHTQALPPSQQVQSVKVQEARDAAQSLQPSASETYVAQSSTPARSSSYSAPEWQSKSGKLSAGVGLNYRQNLGGPDAFWLFQLAVDGRAEWQLRPDTWVSGIYRVTIADNYGRFKYNPTSDLPRVRTYLREYLTTSRDTIPDLQINHWGHVGEDHFYQVYGGLLEPMFGGVGAEYMYRPVNSRFALGVDINRVQQREFDQKFDFMDYRVNTGHVTAYWDTGWENLLVKLSAGQYLAGDRGATLDLSRVFDNGVTMGAYATKTNVSAEQFGEGSFDKGVYVSIPFDVMLPRSSGSYANIVYAPLVRDGGAKLLRRYTLYGLTGLRDPRLWTFGAPATGSEH